MRTLLSAFLCLFFLSSAQAQVNARLMQHPDVSETHICFVYGDDIWVVEKSGGMAHRLSSPAGTEMFPRFSPDGKRIAFTGNYDGNPDVYMMPAAGGVPTRLTHHGMFDRLVDWTPDGKRLLYASSMESGKQRWNQLYAVDAAGSFPEKLPMEHAEYGSLSADGSKIAFTDKSRVSRTWKRYRGGTAADIWIFDLKTYEATNITDHPANDELPMWSGDVVYYLSDRGEELRNNIWAYDTRTKKHRQVTDFADFDVHFPAIGPKEMVFEAGGKLYLLDLATEQWREVHIQVVTDLTAVKPRLENLRGYLHYVTLSPDGSRVLAEARGEVINLPAAKGFVQNLTASSGFAERYPAWAPDGKSIAYWSDRSGEYELMIADPGKPGSAKKITTLGAGFRYQLYWSPDSKKIAFIDQTMNSHVVDVATGKLTHMDKDLNLLEYPLRTWRVSWSPDSRWIAYTRQQDNGNTAIFFFDVKNAKSHQITTGFYADIDPVFSADGKRLFTLTNRSFSPVYGDFDNSWTYPNATQLAVINLTADAGSILAAENDTVKIESADGDKEEMKEGKSDKKDKDKADINGKDGKGKDGDEEVVIDFTDIERRMQILPVTAGNMGRLTALDGKVLFLRYPVSGDQEGSARLNFYDIKERKEKTIIQNAGTYTASADGKKLLVNSNGQWAVIDAAPDQKIDKPVPFDEMKMMLDPMAEWHQIFNDAWRFERDFFYDKNMHGVDWEAMRKQYGELVKYAATRSDVNFILGELIGELNASHTYRGGGDLESPKRRPVGYLGVDFEKDGDLFRVKRIIRGAPWDSEVSSPLAEPGVDVPEGSYILAVNGIELGDFPNPWGAFEGLADKTVALTVNDKPGYEGARQVIVKTLTDETRLRNLAWINANREAVYAASDGKIGYVYVPSTGLDGQNELVRQFMGQWHMEGLIIDERFNNGGQIPDRFIELLNRKPLAFWDTRDGKDWQWPPVAHFGPKAMLINGWSGSGGDAFPDYFRKSGLGKLVGTRTWGGLIGISGAPTLIDNGGVTVPTFRMYDPDGEWFREGHGVDPDVEVIEHPTSLAKGTDPQLVKAVELVLDEIKNKAFVKPDTPKREKR